MFTDSASIILFAIKSTIKLGQQARKAYVDSTRRREIILPLAHYFSSPSHFDALDYFNNSNFGKKYVEGYSLDGQIYEGSEELKALLEIPVTSLSEEQKRRLGILHVKYVNLDRARNGELMWADNTGINGDEFEAVFTVGQWRSGADPTPSVLHRMAGTLIEIGVDYAVNSPDLYDINSKKGKAIHSFFKGLENIDFVETDISELPARLFVATIETIEESPDLISGDLKTQELIKVTTGSISKNVAKKINAINNDRTLDVFGKRKARLRVQDWGTLLYRSTLSSGGRLVMSAPSTFLNTKDADDAALISSVGNAVLDLILDGQDGIDDLISREGLEVVISAALKTIGEHPGILADISNNAIKTVISELARELSSMENLLTPDILPEVVRMTLEKSGNNIELFWPEYADNPKKNLMLVAAKRTLTILSRPPEDNDLWKAQFTKTDLLEVTECVLDELVENPGWLITKTNELSETMGEVLSATVDVLRKQDTNRLNSSTGVEIIRAVLKTAALRQEFVGKLSNGKVVITAAVDVVLSEIFKKEISSKASWQLLRTEVIKGSIEIAMEKLLVSGLDQDAIDTLEGCLKTRIQAIDSGDTGFLESFSKCLTDRFSNS